MSLPPDSDALMENQIFVAIASYRDPECQWTIKDLFESARHPERVTVGICWQFDAERDHVCFTEPNPRPGQVKIINVGLSDTKGACWAKSQALSLMAQETHVLLIDSHMRFAPGWDVEMLATLARINNPKAFLSTYPAGYEPPNQRRFSTPRLTPVKFFDRVLSQDSILLTMDRPLESYLVAGGYLFGKREMFDEVPYDPYIYFIGEEIAHAARFFTHGWDGYTPDKCLIHHFYSRKSATKHWDDEKDHWGRPNIASYRRVRHLLGVERTADPEALQEIERFSLGRIRSLKEFQARIGVNLNAMLIDRKRHETVSNIQVALSNPSPPQSSHELASLGVYACLHGQFMLPKRDAYIGKSLIEYGEWTEGINRLCAILFSAGNTVVEVGAGFGARTVPLARLVGSEGRVVAIEQSRRLCDLLHANLVLNAIDCVSVEQVRAAALPGAVEIVEPMFDTEGGNFGAISHHKKTDFCSPRVLEVPLDEKNLGHVDCLIIDTPGYVNEVLAGGKCLIASHRPAVLINADNTKDAELSLSMLKDSGYRLWRYTCPFFKADNFFNKKDNVFGGLASLCLVALPDARSLAEYGAIPAG